jgi:hypothetical protein
MLGLAKMAAGLAEQRVGYGPMDSNYTDLGAYLCARRELREFDAIEVTFSREYYRIIDRIARGEKP